VATYTDAKVAALVDSSPGALDTLNELAAALGDDANISASIHTSIGNRLTTATHTAFSSSNASALRTEYVASTAALSASAHTRREQISASLDATIDALDSLGISTDTERGALSGSAHTQREAIKGLATAANNTLSGSSAGALRTEYKAGDTALSSSAHTQREAIKGLATTANNSLSSSAASAIRTEYVAGDTALSASAHTQRAAIDAKVGALDSTYATDASVSSLSSSAEVRRNELHALQLLSSSVGASINDSAVKLSGIESGATADQTNAQIAAAVEAASDSNTFTDADHTKLNAIEASADVTDTANVTSAGALMSSSLGATVNDNLVKLSGIESAATADQTASEILTAIKTVDGAGSGLDADKLDGNSSAYFAPSASMKTYVDAKVAGIVDSSPAALNTLNELAAALGDDADFATTTATSIGTKLAKADNLSDLENAGTARTNLGVAKGISDGNVLAANDAVADDDFLRINGTEVEGRSASEVVSDLGIEAGATADQTAAEIRSSVGTGNGNFVPAEGNAGEFLKHDGTFGTPSYTTNTDTNTNQLTTFSVRDDDDDDKTIAHGKFLKFVSATGPNGTELTGTGTTSDPFMVTISSPNDNTNTQNSAATIRTLIGSGNNGHVPTAGTSGHFLKHDGTFGLPSYTTNTNTQLSTADVRGKFTAGTNITITDGDIASTDTNDDVSVANLKTRLAGGFGSNAVQIGDSDDVVTIGGQLSVTSHGTVHCLGVGTAASETAGEIRATGDITAYYSSDERLKENFSPLAGALDKVKAIGGYEFDWKDGIEAATSKTGHDIGVKAQEVQAQYPDLVHERDNGYLAVDYIKLNAVLIEAVKELAAKVDELQK
jgi:hypothetical protein